jgi:hypothetical protein
MSTRVFCTYEDRADDFPAVAILVSSLSRSTPDAQLVIYGRNIPTWFSALVGQYPQTSLVESEGLAGSGWSVKPELLLRILQEGHRRVVWLDSDLIAASDLHVELERAEGPDGAFVTASEPYWNRLEPAASRARAWGLREVRRFSPSLNSCVVDVSQEHRRVLAQWMTMMRSAEYLEAQGAPYAERPAHLAGDQDVLEAVLSAETRENLEVHVLEPDVDLAQCHLADGYSPVGRMRHLWGRTPPIVHSQGFKAWRAGAVRRFHHDVSPYVLLARRYAGALPDGGSWAGPQSAMGRALVMLSIGEPNLPGLPFAAWAAFQRRLRLRTRFRALAQRSRP